MNSEAEKHLISGSSRPQPKVFYLLSIREASQKGHQKLRLINYCSECVLRKSCFQTFSGFGRPFCLVFFFGGGGGSHHAARDTSRSTMLSLASL